MPADTDKRGNTEDRPPALEAPSDAACRALHGVVGAADVGRRVLIEVGGLRRKCPVSSGPLRTLALLLTTVACAKDRPATSVAPIPIAPAAPANGAAAPPVEAAPRQTGRLDPAVIQQVVRAAAPAMKRCYEEGLGRNPGLTGRVTTRFVIDREGHVSSAVLEPHPGNANVPVADGDAGVAPVPAPLDDASVVMCVTKVFSSLTFPKPEGGIVTVVYPLIFEPAP